LIMKKHFLLNSVNFHQMQSRSCLR
jgi:hypothetical protein